MFEYFIILPSLKVSGGVMEAYNLAKMLNNKESKCSIVCLWETKTPIKTENIVIHQITNWKTNIKFAIFQLPIILFKFYFFAKQQPNNSTLLFTHYSTLPLIITLPYYLKRKIFVQGIEWEFIKTPIIKKIFSGYILSQYKKNKILSANTYIKNKLLEKGIESYSMPLWANNFYSSKEYNKNKNTDILIMMRKGFLKRPDLYLSFLKKISKNTSVQIKVITPETEIHNHVRDLGFDSFLSPSKEVIKSLYNDSKIFVFLSENEGFGLPPTEAMGSGCIPICRNSGGPSIYMIGPLAEFLFPLNESIDSIIQKTQNLLNDKKKLEILGNYCIDLFRKQNDIRNEFKINEI